MRYKALIAVLGSLALMASPAMALQVKAVTLTPTGADLTVEYTEPSTNADGSTLVDLAKTNVYVKVGNLQEVKGPDVPASSPTGGQVRSTVIAVVVPSGKEADVTITVTATDLSGNESLRSVSATRRVDKLAPGSPQ
jgi:hypothetical protein